MKNKKTVTLGEIDENMDLVILQMQAECEGYRTSYALEKLKAVDALPLYDNPEDNREILSGVEYWEGRVYEELIEFLRAFGYEIIYVEPFVH